MDGTVLLLPFILSALVTTTFSISCKVCVEEGDKPCQGASVPCPPESDVCVATLQSMTKDGREMTTYTQYCGKTSLCSYSGSLTSNVGAVKVSTTCCYTSNCSPSVPKFPAEKKDKNGMSCGACSSDKGSPCAPSTNIECTGDENQCLQMSSVTGEQTSSISGCGTPGLCKLQDQVIQYGERKKTFSFSCTSGSDPLPPGLPLLLLAAFFIMKVLS